MSCGRYCNRCSLSTSVRIALAGDVPACPIDTNAIFYVLRTGCQWQALDQTELSAHSTAHDRFQEWVQADVFLKLWQVGVERFDELRGINWEWLSMDGAMENRSAGRRKNRTRVPPIVARAA